MSGKRTSATQCDGHPVAAAASAFQPSRDRKGADAVIGRSFA
jgi:hypothetical protein